MPPSVKKAMNITTKAPTIVWARTEAPGNTTAPTPRVAGHPDLCHAEDDRLLQRGEPGRQRLRCKEIFEPRNVAIVDRGNKRA
jgi:hypothetical protein